MSLNSSPAGGFEVRALGVKEAREIYRAHITLDFPREERKPWLRIRRAWMDGRYSAYALYDGDVPAAYAFFCFEKGAEAALMDYFAVVSPRRGQGIGSLFLRMLAPRLTASGYRLILIEAEDPGDAPSGEERMLRERRIAFYMRAGTADTGLRFRVYGVRYAVLILGTPGAGEGGAAVAEEYARLYRHMLGERRFKARFSREEA